MFKNHRSGAAVFFTSLCLFLLAPGQTYGQNVKGYFPEDWVSYTNTRFVTSVGLGWNDIYFGTMGGVTRYNSLERRWKDPITTSDGLASNEVWRLAVSREDDNIWVETPLGIYRYNPLFQEWSYEAEFPDHLERSDFHKYTNLQSFHLDPGFEFSYEMDHAYLSDPAFRNYRIEDAVEDDWYHLWVATYGHGVVDIDLQSGFVNLVPNGLYQEFINAIYIDNDMIWFGGESSIDYDDAITMWNRYDDTWHHYEARYNEWISSDHVYDITGDDKYVFFGTDLGVVKYDKDRDRFSSFTSGLGLRSSEIFSLYLEDSLLLIGGIGTIDVLHIPRDSVFSIHAPIPPLGKVYSMTQSGNNMWVGTEYGLYRFNEKTLKWGRFDTPSGNLGRAVWQGLEGSSGDIWFAGIDGIVHLDSNLREIETIRTRQELNGKLPHRIAHAGNYLWVGTDNGVLRYDRVMELWTSYDTEEGLIDNYINDVMVEDDYIWFATPEGVTRYYWNNPLRISDK
jgi:ligand-binding sensor domain-containing protein